MLLQTSCLSACPDGYYHSSGVCVLCASPCLYCFNQSACKSCQPSLYLFNLTCSIACPSGSYTPTGSSFSCVSCPLNCTQCLILNNVVRCTNCSQGYFLENATCNIACSQFTFANTVEARCDRCAGPCLTCSNNIERCTSCIIGYSLVQQQGLCYAKCPSTYYNDANSMCTACSPPCR